LASVPGAEAFGLVNYVPLYENMSLQPVVVQGRPEPPVAERPAVNTLIVTPGYFSTMNVRLMAGRFFTPSDGPAAGAVCVVDQKFVESYFPGEDPLGRQLSSGLGSERTWCRIVGVVEPRDQIVWDREPRRTWYRPVAQMQPRVLSVVLRTGSPMPATLAALKQAVFAVDPEQPVRQLYSQQQLIDNALGGLRLVAVLMTGVGVIALLLSAIGIFSLVSYVVSERTPEIGMRMAMGASSRDILTLVSRQTVVMGSLGLTLGLAIGYALAQSFSRLIWGVSSKDFWSLASVSLLLAIVGATATYIPARRAMRLDPMEALRHD
jgi:predicted permease